MGLAYRLRQFWRLISVEPFPEDAWQTVEEVLQTSELRLFRNQEVADQTHGLRVFRTLQAAGETDRRLLAAALLHDVGKCHMPPTLWDRVAGALGERLFPGQAEKWSRADASFWRRPFVIRYQHPTWGARMAQQVGSDATTVRLIAYHQDKANKLPDQDEQRLLKLLQWADNQN